MLKIKKIMEFTHSKNIYGDKSANRCIILMFILSMMINYDLKARWLTTAHNIHERIHF